MGKGLIITEKPSVARDIVQALGGFEEKNKGAYYESDEYVCTFAVGHILTLFSPEDIKPEYKRWRLADLPIIPENYKTKPLPKTKDRLAVIVKLMNRKDVDYLINACDAAREGELIFREIVSYAESPKPIKRLWLQSMTKQAIRDGFASLEEGSTYEGLAHSAECRAYADWLIGMNATRALTVRLKSKSERGLSWSAGRVQTPTLGLLVNRELEILQHEPIPYWKIQATFSAADHDYEGTWFDESFKRVEDDRDHKDDRIFDKTQAEAILKGVEGKPALASEVRKPSPKKAPQLFDLTTLQRVANSRFGWSATRTLRAAQRCYETHKVLTYPRTSSKALPNDYREEVQKILGIFSQNDAYGRHAAKLLNDGLQNDDKVFDDAGVTDHFAIIPTGEITALEGDDFKLFDLVARQFMAAFYPAAIYEDVERITRVGHHAFRSKPPKVLTFPGWEAVFEKEAGAGESKSYPPLKPGAQKSEGVAVKVARVSQEDLETKPPTRISEAGLLSLMENAGRQVEDEELASALNKAEGLGTAATRADIIENLKLREYVDNNLRPTPKGIRLIDVLHRIHASRLVSPELTAKLEFHLNEVEAEKRTPAEFMQEIESYVKEVVEAARNFDYETIYPDQESLGPCPKCGGPVYEKAWFYGCQESTKRVGKKSCDFLIWKDNNGRYINPSVVKSLLSHRRTRELDGFKSASGNSYKAILELDGGSLVRVPVESSSSDADGDSLSVEINTEPLGPCPVHQDGSCRVVETSQEYICETKQAAKKDGDKSASGFSFPRFLCKREIKRPEVEAYLQHGETDYLTGFISKKGRKFSAKLKREGDGWNFGFVFPERTKASSKKGEQASESSEEAATTS